MGRGGRGAGARLGLAAGGLAVELGDEPVEAVEVVLEPLLGVVLGVAEDADRAAVAAVADRLEQVEVERPLAQRQDLPADLVAAAVHAVEVQAQQVGHHLLEQRREAVEVVVAVVEVVDDPDVRDPLPFSRSMMAIWFSGSPNQPPWL